MVQIESFDDEGTRIDCGVGVLVRPNIVLTAQHVLRPDLVGTHPKPVAYVVRAALDNRPVRVQPGVSGVELVELPGASSHLDVAFLRLGTSEVVDASDATSLIGRIADKEIGGSTSQAVILSYHSGDCHASSESEGSGLLEHPTTLQPSPPVTTGRRVSSPRLKLAPRLLDSYSGSPIVSTTFGSIVAIYTDGDAGSSAFGYATSFDEPAVADLFTSVLGTPPRPESKSYRRWYPRTNSSAALTGQTIATFDLASRWEVSPLLAFAWELTPFPAARPETSLAIRIAPLASVGAYQRRYLAPVGDAVLESRTAYYGAGAIELGLEARLRRLQRWSPAISLNGRVGGGKDRAGPFLLYAGVLRTEIELSSGSWGFALEAVASYGVQPGADRRYTGLSVEAEYAGRRAELLLGCGPKISF